MRVSYVVRPDAGLFMGGGEIQALATLEAVRACGIDARIHSSFDTDLGDLVHFFGLFPGYGDIAHHCRERNVPYVVSPIFAVPKQERTLRFNRWRHRLKPGRFPRSSAVLLQGAKRLFVNSGFEGRRLTAYFGSPLPPMRVVPNGVDPMFANSSPEPFQRWLGSTDPFVLHAAAVDPNKNALGLARALAGTEMPAIFIGRMVDSKHKLYWEAVQSAAGPLAKFLDPIGDRTLFASCVAACRVFCLPSRFETFCLAAAEAVVARKPVVLANSWSADEIFGRNATYVDPDDPTEIRAAVQTAWDSQADRSQDAAAFAEVYSWPRLAEMLAKDYEFVVGSND